MKRKFILIGAIAASSAAYSQIGINTPTPASSLDVVAKNATGTTTNVDGLLIPRVDRQRAQSMTGIPTSTLIYVNSIATGTATGTTVNVDAVGYYYFNGTAWVKLHNPTNISNIDVNIYNADGTLTGNRIVTQNANTLAFTGTSANAFSVDGNTFSVDAAGNQVGIGTTTPGEKLDVKGAITYVGQAVANKTGAASIDYASSTVPAQARILSWGPDAATNGIISFWTGLGGAVANEKMRIHSNGNVGIGTVTPQKPLHVNGALQVTNELNVGGNATTAGSAGTAGQILISGGAGAAPSWQNASATSVNIYNADGTLTGNRVVTQGANTLAFTGTSTNAFSVDGNTLSVDAANNQIGIGTATPSVKLDVQGSQLLNAAVTAAATKNALDINIGQDGSTYGNRVDNYGINMKTASSVDAGAVARINFGDTSTGSISGIGERYLSFSVGKPLNELLYMTNANSGRIGVGTITPQKSFHVNGTLQVTNELNVGGNANTAGSAGTAGQILVSGGAGAAPSWQNSSTLTTTNIYNADGTLTGNRVVTQGANTLAFNSTAVNGFSVDGNTFSVDAAGNQIGVGTATPVEKVDVKGAIAFTGQAATNKTGAGTIDYAASTVPAQTRILSWGPDAATSGIISFWTGLGGAVANEKMRVHSNGNIGIGTITPQKLLHVNGALQVTNELNVGGNATTAGSAGTAGQVLVSNGAGTAPSWQNAPAASTNIYNTDGTLTGNRVVTQNANTLTFNTTAANGFAVAKTGIGYILSVDGVNSRVGIGTTTPTNKLEINNGTTAGAIKIVDGTQGSNKVLTSDANGVGTWNSLAGAWFGLLRVGSSTALGPIDFGFGSVVGQGGSANPATDTITVPTTGLYEITISGWSQNTSGSPYLTTWDLARNGSTIGNPHYASPSASYGTETSVTNYYNLTSGDSIKLGLGNPFSSPFPANSSQRVSLAVKLIQ